MGGQAGPRVVQVVALVVRQVHEGVVLPVYLHPEVNVWDPIQSQKCALYVPVQVCNLQTDYLKCIRIVVN